MGFRFQFSWELFSEPYGIFLLLIAAATLFYAVACAMALGAAFLRHGQFSKRVAFLFILLTLVLNLDVARTLEMALHAGLFSLKTAITHASAAVLLWLIVLCLGQKNARI